MHILTFLDFIEQLPKSVDDDHVDGRLKYLEEEIRSMVSLSWFKTIHSDLV